MLFDAWLDSPLWVICAVLVTAYATLAYLLHRLSFKTPGRASVATLAGVSPSMFGTVGVLFALMTSFLANDIWDAQRRAVRAVQMERDTVSAVWTLSGPDRPPPQDNGVRLALREYVFAVVDDEWPRMAEERASERADTALAGLLRNAAASRFATQSGPVIQTAMLRLVQDLRAARAERLSLSAGNYDGAKWATVLVLAGMVQISLAVCHLDRPRAQATALWLFTASAVLVLTLLAVRERPFHGVYAIRDTSIRTLLTTLQP